MFQVVVMGIARVKVLRPVKRVPQTQVLNLTLVRILKAISHLQHPPQQSHSRPLQLSSQSRRQRLIAMVRLLVKAAVRHWAAMRIKWREWAKERVALVMGKDRAVEPVRD